MLLANLPLTRFLALSLVLAGCSGASDPAEPSSTDQPPITPTATEERPVPASAVALEDSPGYADYENALALRAVNELRGATKAAKAAIAKDSQRAEFHSLLGDLFVAQRVFTGARESYQTSLQLASQNGAVWHNLGLVNYTLGAFEFAEQCLFNATQAFPDGAASHYHLGLARFRLALQGGSDDGVNEEVMRTALGSLERAAELEPENVEAHLQVGKALQRLNDPSAAAGRFDAVLAMDPQNVEGHVRLAVCLREAGDVERALELLEAALVMDPNFAAAHHALGELEEDAGDLAAARAAYQAAVERDPGGLESLGGLMRVCQSLGFEEEAEDLRSQIRQIKAVADAAERERAGGRIDALYEVGIGHQMEGRNDEAERTFREVLEADPDHVKAMTQIGQLLRDRGRLEEALVYFTRAIELEPTYARAWRLQKEVRGLLRKRSDEPGGSEEAGGSDEAGDS